MRIFQRDKYILKNKNLKVYLFLILPLIIYVTFFIIPNIKTIVYSFVEWDGINPVKKFIGIDNYRRLFGDILFLKTLKNTIIYTTTIVVFDVTGGIVVATLIYKKTKTNITFRTLIFLPAMISSVAIGIIWSFMYDANVGAINFILEKLGIEFLQKHWLSDPKLAIFTVASVHIWESFGYGVILFIAGLQDIPKEIFEAAKVDGVNNWQNFTRITIPLLKSTIALVWILSTIFSFIAFDFVYVMTRGGADHSSEVLATYLYKQGFRYNNVGYSSAIATVLFSIVLIMAVFQLRVSKEY